MTIAIADDIFAPEAIADPKRVCQEFQWALRRCIRRCGESRSPDIAPWLMGRLRWISACAGMTAEEVAQCLDPPLRPDGSPGRCANNVVEFSVQSPVPPA